MRSRSPNFYGLLLAAGLSASASLANPAGAEPVYHDENSPLSGGEPYPLPDHTCYFKDINGVYSFKFEGTGSSDEIFFVQNKITDTNIAWYKSGDSTNSITAINKDGVPEINPSGTPYMYTTTDGNNHSIPLRIKWTLTVDNKCLDYRHLSDERLAQVRVYYDKAPIRPPLRAYANFANAGLSSPRQ